MRHQNELLSRLANALGKQLLEEQHETNKLLEAKPTFEVALEQKKWLQVLTDYEFREVSAFVANELAKMTQRIDALYTEFAAVNKMKKSMAGINRQASLLDNQNDVCDKLDIQFEVLRKQLLSSQERHSLLKSMKH